MWTFPTGWMAAIFSDPAVFSSWKARSGPKWSGANEQSEENPWINFESFSISSALFDVTKCLHHFTETLPDAGPLIIYMYEIYPPFSELFQNCLHFYPSQPLSPSSPTVPNFLSPFYSPSLLLLQFPFLFSLIFNLLSFSLFPPIKISLSLFQKEVWNQINIKKTIDPWNISELL